MKITKTKEVITEEVEVNPGTYYFEDEDLISYKMVVEEVDEEGFADYTLETITNFGNITGIRIRKEWMDADNIPYVFKQFILGISGKKIEKEEYYKEREEVKQKL